MFENKYTIDNQIPKLLSILTKTNDENPTNFPEPWSDCNVWCIMFKWHQIP